jgi:hypothetical protein
LIVDDPEEAARIVAAGGAVVLVVRPADAPVEWPAGPGRMAVFVGDPDDPAARSMAAELLGPGGAEQSVKG